MKEAELSTIGCLIIDAEHCSEIFDTLTAEDFIDPECKKIFEYASKLHNDGKAVDAVTILAEFENDGPIRSTVLQAAETLPTTANYQSYMYFVKQASIKRYAKERLTNILLGITPAAEAQYVALEMQQAADDVKKACSERTQEFNFTKQAIEYIHELYEPENDKYIKTGMVTVDKLLYGLPRGEVTGIAARPGVGKTTLALNLTYELIKNGRKVLFDSLEMTEKQVIEKLAALACNVPTEKLKSKTATEEEKTRIVSMIGKTSDSRRLEIIGDGYKTARITQSINDFQPDVVVIDYLQYMYTNDNIQRKECDRIEAISRAVKEMAKRTGVAVVLLSQLNRESEQGSGRPPKLSDLRSSGAIEQDLAACLMLHRPGMTDENEDMGKTMLLCTKNRFGSVGANYMRFDLSTQRFYDYDTIH